LDALVEEESQARTSSSKEVDVHNTLVEANSTFPEVRVGS